MQISINCNYSTFLHIFNYILDVEIVNMHHFVVRNDCLVVHNFSCASSTQQDWKKFEIISLWHNLMRII